MIRWQRLVLGVLAASVLAAGFGPATAQAQSDTEPSCNYTLSAPQLVVVSGVTMVTATLAPFPCTGRINPNSMTVCVSAPGDGTSGECGFEARPIPARVFVPFRPGTTYESSGRGCGSISTPTASTCTTVGPKTATF